LCNKVVLVKSHRGQNLQDCKGAVKLSGNEHNWERWLIVDAGDGNVFIRSNFKRNLQAADWKVKLSENSLGWEKFTLLDAGDGKVFIQSHNSRMLQDFHGSAKLSPNQLDWEKWTLHAINDGEPPAEIPVAVPPRPVPGSGDSQAPDMDMLKTASAKRCYFFFEDSETGNFLRCEDQQFKLHSCTDDATMFTLESCAAEGDNRFKSVISSAEVLARRDGSQVFANVNIGGHAPIRFKLRKGSLRLPSQHLAELRERGLTIVENVLSIDDCIALKDSVMRTKNPRGTDARYTFGGGLELPDVCKAVANPISLWIMRQQLGDKHIKCAHEPKFSVIMPSTGKSCSGKDGANHWHTDYPWKSEALAVQCNVCVDEFTKENGATQYVPGSHNRHRKGVHALNKGRTKPGEGIHKDVISMLAPAGAALLYDARTWHRACPEANFSERSRVAEDSQQKGITWSRDQQLCRVAILNAVTKNGVKPMFDPKKAVEQQYKTDVRNKLTGRQRLDMHHLFSAPQ
jgi:hypothetical protein